jgi:hypothetical protein
MLFVFGAWLSSGRCLLRHAEDDEEIFACIFDLIDNNIEVGGRAQILEKV